VGVGNVWQLGESAPYHSRVCRRLSSSHSIQKLLYSGSLTSSASSSLYVSVCVCLLFCCVFCVLSLEGLSLSVSPILHSSRPLSLVIRN
jgi:hypothetical protein